MEEYIDIVTKEGKPTGQSVLKSEIHSKGYYHNTAHLWLYTNEGQILIAQRAASKLICPLLWDVSVAGHVDSGETIEKAAIRETLEEISLTLSEADLVKIGVFECFQSYPNGITDNEFHHTFISELKVPIEQLIPQTGEVEALKLFPIKTFEEKLKFKTEDNYFIKSNKAYYQFVLKAIKNAIKK